jgi:serine/threonine protein kinase
VDIDAIYKFLKKNHPNIVNIHNVWTERVFDEKLFIQMDWVGATTRNLLELGWRFEGSYWFDVAWAIAHGISQAHQHGIVHGDLKLSNGSTQLTH